MTQYFYPKFVFVHFYAWSIKLLGKNHANAKFY